MPDSNAPVPSFLTRGPASPEDLADRPSAVVRRINQLKEVVMSPRQPATQVQQFDDTLAQKGMEQWYQLKELNTRLAHENHDLKLQLASATAAFENLKSTTARLQAERDTYMRFSTDITTRLNVVRQTVDDAMQEATRYAYKPPAIIPVPDAADKPRLEKLEREIAGESQ